MSARSPHLTEDRIILSRTGRPKAMMPQAQRRSYLWTIAGGLLGSTILFWMMVQLGQASSEPKGKPSQPPSAKPVVSKPGGVPQVSATELEDEGKLLPPPAKAAQGPALDAPREVIEMLELRKRDLDRREEAVRQNEERLMVVRVEVEKLLTKNEALEKRIQNAGAKADQQTTDLKAQQAKALLEKERQTQEQKIQLAKMYESMPAEEAAARLERIPDRKAIEILRLVKGKTAGAILAQVKADRAAKLTEQLLAREQ